MNRMCSYPIEEEKKHECEKTAITSNDWVCNVSDKALRTHNPIRAIVDPIVANSIKCGKERGDGKDQISLAVCFIVFLKYLCINMHISHFKLIACSLEIRQHTVIYHHVKRY